MNQENSVMASVDELLNNVCAPRDEILSHNLYAASTHGCTSTIRDPNIAECRSLLCRMPGRDWASRTWDTDHETTMHGIAEALIHERAHFG